jgi:hypothetical protein
VLAADELVSKRRLESEVREQFDRARLLGEVARPEASNPTTFASAIDALVRRRVLVQRRTDARRDAVRDTLYTRGPAFDELGRLRERLAAALASG